jgi:hypothetical protein
VAIAVAQTANTAPTWKANTPTSLGTFTAGVGGTFDFSQYAFDAEGDPIFYYRTGGTTDTAPGTVTVNETAGAGTIPGSLSPGSYSMAVRLAGSAAEADWLARSTGSGVVFAHDFRSDAEVSAFLDVASGQTVARSTDGITGGSLEVTLPGNPLLTVSSMTTLGATSARVVTSTAHGLTTSDFVRFADITGAWSGFNDSVNGASGLIEKWTVTAVNSATSFDISTVSLNTGFWPTINTSGFAAYGGGGTAQRCRVGVGAWNRPFSAIPAGRNGLSTDDPGIALGMPPRLWDHTAADPATRNYNYRKDYYAHADYASLINTWRDGGGGTQDGNLYRGADFWVQFRVKISAPRYQLAGVSPRSPSLKMCAIWNVAETPLHEVVVMDCNIANDAPYTTALPFEFYTGAGSSKTFSKGVALQPGGDFPNCRYDPWAAEADCFHTPADEWITYLIHVIPGKHQGWTGWPVPADGSIATGIQVWVARQGQTTYQSLINCTGADGFPFFYENAPGPATSPVAPGWNSLWLTTYQNNIPVPVGWTRKFAQVIFKKGNGGSNPNTDGIRCPQV